MLPLGCEVPNGGSRHGECGEVDDVGTLGDEVSDTVLQSVPAFIGLM